VQPFKNDFVKRFMTPINSFEQLEAQLEKRICGSDVPKELGTDPFCAYKKGMQDALELVLRFKAHCRSAKADHPAESSEKPAASALKLHQVPPENVVQLDLADPATRSKQKISHADMVEAAFHFENQLLGLLGDANTIPFDAYEGLAPETLAGIISQCAGKICRLEKK
jgi:hypothetical protein